MVSLPLYWGHYEILVKLINSFHNSECYEDGFNISKLHLEGLGVVSSNHMTPHFHLELQSQDI